MYNIYIQSSLDPQDKENFIQALNRLKITLAEYERPQSALRPDMVANDFRKTLEIFITYIYTNQTSNNLYSNLLQLCKQINQKPDQNYIDDGDHGYIKALLKIVQTLGNYGSHHQLEAQREINHHHIIMCRIALYTLLAYYLHDNIPEIEYSFLKLAESDKRKRSNKSLVLKTSLLILIIFTSISLLFIIKNSNTHTQSSSFTVNQCKVITDKFTNLQWFVGPDQTTSWSMAKSWVKDLNSKMTCGGQWKLPSLAQINTLHRPNLQAGKGPLIGNQRWPARMDPVFSALGEGAWIWVSSRRKNGVTMNLNRWVLIHTHPEKNYTTRVLAVRSMKKD